LAGSKVRPEKKEEEFSDSFFVVFQKAAKKPGMLASKRARNPTQSHPSCNTG